MKGKRFLLAIALFVSGFFPVTIHAGVDPEKIMPPSIAVWLGGGVLHIQADEGSGVSVVYINGEKLEYPEAGLSVDAAEYADDNGKLAIYAADDSGNVSNTVTLYLGPDDPGTTPPLKPLTPDGSGTVVDDATNADGKEFYTFKTPANNVFYLIIDHQRGSDNVYLLNQVTEQDLLALAEDAKKAPLVSLTPTPAPTHTPTPTPSPAPSQTDTPPVGNNKGAMDPKLMILLLLAGIGVAVGYYFKAVRPKQKKPAYNSGSRESGGDDYDSGDGMGEGFDYEDREIPYDREDNLDDDWDD